MTTADTAIEVHAIKAQLDKPLSSDWNKVPGITVEGRSVRVDPGQYFFRYDNPSWIVCDWEAVRQQLLTAVEESNLALEQATLEFVRHHGVTTDDGGRVLRTAEQVYAHVFRAEHLDDPGLDGLTLEHLRILREMGIMMALNRVELSGTISNVGPAWFFPVCSRQVFGLDDTTANMIDELYHGTFFNESRRVESVKAHAALGGRLVHGCQSAPDQSGGCVVPFGADIAAFTTELDGLKGEWMERIRRF